MTNVHPLDAALALQPAGEGRFDGRTHADWANMVGPFGGITAAQLLQAACLDPRRIGEPLALTVNFAAAVTDGAFTVRAEPARTNRSTQHWTLSIEQGGQVCTTGSAVFAARRPTWSAAELQMPAVPPAAEVPRVTRGPAVAWPQRYDMRFVAGGWPDYGRAGEHVDSRSLVWARDEPPRPLDAPALAAMADMFYPRVFRRRMRFAPAGTVTLSTYFHADAAELAALGTAHVLGVAQGRRFTQGFFDQSAELWSADGRLLASSHQMVYFKD